MARERQGGGFRRFLVGLLALVGLLTLLVVVGGGIAIWWVIDEARSASAVPDKAILRFAIHGSPTETGAASGAVRRLLGGERATGLRDVTGALAQAAEDPRILGVLVDLSDARPSLAAAQELRRAVQRFRASGKPAIAFADSFGEAGRATQAFDLAAGFEQIWLQPSGEVGVTGFALDNPFLADALDMLGVKARFAQRHEFKGGVDMFLDRAYPEPLKASLQGLLGDLMEQLVESVAQARKLSPEVVRGLIDRAPLFADEAKAAGLIDQIGYADEAAAALRQRAGTGRFVALDTYLADVGLPHAEGEKIALIYGVGPVMRGGDDEDENPFSTSQTLSAETVARAFRQAAADPAVRAIVFRIDSPGGSYVASDTVWREIKRAREAGKPVVASMGSMAASGGYFVAMACDRVIAAPGTLTGSIGVYSGKFVLDGLWRKLGISWDQVKAGANADLSSPNRDFTPEQWQRFEAGLDRVYADFTRRVGADRKLDAAKLDAVARGRVWTGRQAVGVGLADATGDFEDALAAARQLAGLAPDAAIHLERFPPERTPFERLVQLIGELDRSTALLHASARLATTIGAPLLQLDSLLRAQELSSPVRAP